MNKLFFFIIPLIFFSCSNKNNENSTTTEKESKSVKTEKETDKSFFVNDAEKITLLCLSKNLPRKQVYSILRDYFDKTLLLQLDEGDSEYYDKVIDTIARKNNLTKQKTASIIFSYQYELITSEEIIDNYNSERENYLNEKQTE